MLIHLLTTKQLKDLRAALLANCENELESNTYIEACKCAIAEIDDLVECANAALQDPCYTACTFRN